MPRYLRRWSAGNRRRRPFIKLWLWYQRGSCHSQHTRTVFPFSKSFVLHVPPVVVWHAFEWSFYRNCWAPTECDSIELVNVLLKISLASSLQLRLRPGLFILDSWVLVLWRVFHHWLCALPATKNWQCLIFWYLDLWPSLQIAWVGTLPFKIHQVALWKFKFSTRLFHAVAWHSIFAQIELISIRDSDQISNPHISFLSVPFFYYLLGFTLRLFYLDNCDCTQNFIAVFCRISDQIKVFPLFQRKRRISSNSF